MDIQYLLMLQDLRHSLPQAFETFFSQLSVIGEGPGLVVIILAVYWCIDKRAGQFALTAFATSTLANQLVKNTACVYRPWIRDAAIVPAESAVEGAGGYSFPSGHTTDTAASLGSFAWLARHKSKVVVIICVVVIVLMGFARNYLGVHTPQDVVVGLLLGLAAIPLTQLFFNWIDRCDANAPGHNKDIVTMVVVIVLCAASIAYVVLKPYPMDYVDGELLVDPVAMQKGSFQIAGMFSGLAVGWVLERRFVSFSTEGLTARTRVIRLVVSLVVFGIAYAGFDLAFKAIMPYNWAKLCGLFIAAIVGVYVAPAIFNKLEKKQQQPQPQN